MADHRAAPPGAEKTGYPTQKPLRILERIVRVHSDPGDLVLDLFAGSGTTGEAAARLGRGYLLVDENPEAVRVMRERLAWDGPEAVEATGPATGSASPPAPPAEPAPETRRGRLLAEPAPVTSQATAVDHSGTIASLGHDSTQVAQSSHFSGSMT